MVFIGLLIIPFIIMAFCFFYLKDTISWVEFVAQLLMQSIIIAISIAIIFKGNVLDYEVWSGKVIDKSKDMVSCSHDYPCNCREECSGSGESETCSTVCDTCYEHSHDYDWNVLSDIATFTVERIDEQGVKTPPRWTLVRRGDPVAVKKRYDNYIKASNHSLFKKKTKENKNVPSYPLKIYDIYNINRLVTTHKFQINSKEINEKLMEVNSRIGPRSQANLILVLTKNDEEFFYDLISEWDGAKKNDVVVVLGLNDDLSVKWSKSHALTDNSLFLVQLDHELKNKEFSLSILDEVENKVLNGFKRKPMKDFEYLKSSIQPTTTQFTVAMIFGIMFSVITTLIFHRGDLA